MSARERKKDNNNIIDRSGDTKKKERGKRVREKRERERDTEEGKQITLFQIE